MPPTRLAGTFPHFSRGPPPRLTFQTRNRTLTRPEPTLLMCPQLPRPTSPSTSKIFMTFPMMAPPRKKRFARHCTFPMWVPWTESDTYIFCWGCLQAANDNIYMCHPDPWPLGSTPPRNPNKLTQPAADHTFLQNRPWPLQSVDAEYMAKA